MERSQDHYRAFDDLIDEILELDFEDMVVSKKLRQAYQNKHSSDLSSKDYYHHLLDLQSEMIKVQDWVKKTGAKILIICEGRDSAGKGSVIKRISQRMDPRVARVVALPKPTDREMSQWYFQRYVPHLPAGGEIVFFDRSWYNRAGVERVMEFASHEEIEQFFQDVPEFDHYQ